MGSNTLLRERVYELLAIISNWGNGRRPGMIYTGTVAHCLEDMLMYPDRNLDCGREEDRELARKWIESGKYSVVKVDRRKKIL